MRLSDPSAKIYIAGHRGMVGSAVGAALKKAGYTNLIGRTSSELDLRDQAATRAFMAEERPDVVVVAAAKVGGILANDTYPADFLYDNLAIEMNLIEAAHRVGVDRLLFLGSTCIYPKHAPQPMKEEHLLTGELEPTNEWYAIAKISGHKLCEAYHRQHGDDMITLMPTNLYGPDDNFDLETSHVLPALIRKFHEAPDADDMVTLWGTGTPRREFLHSRDLADAVRFVLETPESQLRDVAPDGMLNIGVGEDISINELADVIRDVVSSEADIKHDTSKPDGTPRKLLDVSRMSELGWNASIGLREGIRDVYDWYLDHEKDIVRV
ncbi:GDP-fucose synthetase [Longibacter salinarum]|uniref:GDP-L-fucose synthase n=1 Tax=Longibacter salinarum TaxID=1850348 RepID=A0A2A8D0R2_9BACT|nr:GDP-L-fucose synthase [Longibacter salinarum]PEN14516.1 GDP-fucose synthetase [Longibacter salinarum]